MSTESIMQSIHTLIELHQQMKELSIAKTTIVKDENIRALQPILSKEQLLIQQIAKVEQVRSQQVEDWFIDNAYSPEVERTLTNMLEQLKNEDRAKLEKATVTLTYIIRDIKEQEHMNHGLIQQSLQFVHMSLSMLQPSIQHLNYGKSETKPLGIKHSSFDSKA